MSILIKGMEIPTKEYGKMVVTIYPSGHVVEYLGDMGRDFGTAIPVPPHGDLIDREALMDDIIGSMVFSGRNVPKEAAVVQKVLDIVGDANAIIPASEEGSSNVE